MPPIVRTCARLSFFYRGREDVPGGLIDLTVQVVKPGTKLDAEKPRWELLPLSRKGRRAFLLPGIFGVHVFFRQRLKQSALIYNLCMSDVLNSLPIIGRL